MSSIAAEIHEVARTDRQSALNEVFELLVRAKALPADHPDRKPMIRDLHSLAGKLGIDQARLDQQLDQWYRVMSDLSDCRALLGHFAAAKQQKDGARELLAKVIEEESQIAVQAFARIELASRLFDHCKGAVDQLREIESRMISLRTNFPEIAVAMDAHPELSAVPTDEMRGELETLAQSPSDVVDLRAGQAIAFAVYKGRLLLTELRRGDYRIDAVALDVVDPIKKRIEQSESLRSAVRKQ